MQRSWRGFGHSQTRQGSTEIHREDAAAADLTELGEGIRHSGAGLERRPSATEWRSSDGDPTREREGSVSGRESRRKEEEGVRR